MAAELIGLARCWNPRCGSDKARATLAKNQLAVLTCNACNSQVFARSDRSDQGIRSLLLAPVAEDTKPATQPAPAAPAPAPIAAPADKPRSMGWGVLG